MRSLAAFFALAMPCMTIAPLMPTAQWGIPALGVAAFALSLQQALSPVAIQLFTPNQMRAQVVAVFFVISVFSAIAGGTLSVAVVTDYVFRDENDLGYSLAIVSAVTMTLAAISLTLGIKPYRKSLERAEAWREEMTGNALRRLPGESGAVSGRFRLPEYLDLRERFAEPLDFHQATVRRRPLGDP